MGMVSLNKIYHADCLELTKSLPESFIDCVITSPPYYQLRDYGWTGQWGLEKTYQEYLDHLIELMTELKRVLKPTGTMWINLGDSYGTYRGKGGGSPDSFERNKYGDNKTTDKYIIDRPDKGAYDKCLLLIPHRFALRCTDELGLILRNDIIWAKRNGMPESCTDRFSKKHEFFFFFVKQQKYYFDLDAIRDEHKSAPKEIQRQKRGLEVQGYSTATGMSDGHSGGVGFSKTGKNPGSVSDFWDIPTQPSSEKHYATYNYKLINKPIIAGCPEGGVIFDPFAGTGTTLARAIQLNRRAIGSEGKMEYCEIANKRIKELQDQGTLAL